MEEKAKRFRRHTILVSGLVCFLIGIGIGQRFSRVLFMEVALAALTVGLIMVFRQHSWLTLVIVMMFAAVLGVSRGSYFSQLLRRYDTYYGHAVKATVVASSDAVYGYNKQLSFDAQNIVVDGQPLKGKLAVAGFGENMIYQGDTVAVSGSLRPARGSYAGRLSFAKLQIIHHQASPVDRLRRKFGAALTSVLPEPLGPFGMGLLIGQRSTLPDDAKNTLLWVGLTHIIAVSGYNLTVMLQATRRLLKRGSKYQIMIISLSLIAIFLLFAGNCPSIVRAALVSSIGLVAWYYGRRLNPLLLILLVAGITAYANPAYVWSDSGWYLSFLAFFGVVVVGPLVHAALPKRIVGSILGAMVLETLCAEAMTLPYVLHVFGQMSLVSLPANILIASFVPLAMLCTVIAGLAGMLLLPVAGWFAWPANAVLNYMLDGCRLLSRIPHVFVDHHFLSLAGMLCCYAAVAVCSFIFWRKYATVTDRNLAKVEELYR